MDLYTLGLEIKSIGWKEAKKQMDELTGAAKRAEAAVTGSTSKMSGASERVKRAVKESSDEVSQSSDKMTGATGRATRAAEGMTAQILRMVNPTRLLAGALVNLATSAATAAISWSRAQREIELGLIGVGSAAGLTASNVNRISFEAAAAGDATVSAAREMTMAFAATGKIGADLSAQLVSMGKAVSAVFGEDMRNTALRLARAFADPVRGVETLNQRLAAFDDATVQRIRLLVAQGDRFQAQQMLLDGVRRSTESATASTHSWTRAWNGLTEAASRYWALFAQGSANALGMGDIETQLAQSWERLERLRRNAEKGFGQHGFNIFGLGGIGNRTEIEREYQNYLKLSRMIEGVQKQAREAELVMRSIEIGDLARRVVPDGNVYSILEADLTRLTTAMGDFDLRARLGAEGVELLGRAIEVQKNKVRYFMNEFDRAVEAQDFAMRSAAAETIRDRGQLAFDQSMSRTKADGRYTSIEMQLLAMRERHNVEQAAEIALARAQRDRLGVAQDMTTTLESQLQLVGANRFEQERSSAVTAARLQLENEALRNYGQRDAYSRKHLDALTEQIEKQTVLNKLIATENLRWDLQFERDQLGRSQREQSVYGQLNAMGLLTHGQIADPIAAGAAEMIRFNEVMRITQDTSKDFFSGFIRDVVNGTSATLSLANAMSRLGDKLLQMAMDDALSSILAPFSKSVASGATTGASGGLLGGVLIPGILHEGGVVGSGEYPHRAVPASTFANATRYHNGGIAGMSPLRPNEVPAILERGEVVIPKNRAQGQGGGLSVSAPINVNIDASGADPKAVARLELVVERLHHDLPAHIVSTVRNARQRNML
ncbi:phage tail length tape measure family protein [Hyphomicrobium sp.]|uniref:phage tail length tape measure family protein n=1 Tax=Hyphomicrobium sp. TaxID=82 RepID=UPI002D0C7F45|nr:phage tail length tape measure family protein [Hyphomicrobium sp.]HRQ25802.1 phage tail length tape measure family protein [Hyphomicrobium sp.]